MHTWKHSDKCSELKVFQTQILVINHLASVCQVFVKHTVLGLMGASQVLVLLEAVVERGGGGLVGDVVVRGPDAARGQDDGELARELAQLVGDDVDLVGDHADPPHPGGKFNRNHFGFSFGVKNHLGFDLRFPTL